MPQKVVAYVIQLEPGEGPKAQWYVGITNDPERRFDQHEDGPGAIWTERNTIVKEYPLAQGTRREAKRVENHLTKFLMQEFGVDTTRGGDYTRLNLGNQPDLGDILLPPRIGRLLLESGNARLARAARGNIGVRLSVREPITFRSTENAHQWADENLPEGTKYQLIEPCWNRTFRDVARDEPE